MCCTQYEFPHGKNLQWNDKKIDERSICLILLSIGKNKLAISHKQD